MADDDNTAIFKQLLQRSRRRFLSCFFQTTKPKPTYFPLPCSISLDNHGCATGELFFPRRQER
jgi:hypothetical protein